jgi:hypothetical protein
MWGRGKKRGAARLLKPTLHIGSKEMMRMQHNTGWNSFAYLELYLLYLQQLLTPKNYSTIMNRNLLSYRAYSKLGVLVLFLLMASVANNSFAQGRKKTIGKSVPKEPCENTRSDKKFFRAWANAESPRNDMSKRMAETSCKAKLAGLIKTKVKQVTDDYVQQMQAGDKTEVMQKYEQMTRTVVDQVLINLEVICDETLVKKDQKDKSKLIYNSYVGIQISKEDLMEAMDKSIAKDERLKVDYNKKKFEETFDKEMDKLEKEQNEGGN